MSGHPTLRDSSGGNYFDKYGTGNPLYRLLVRGYLRSLDLLIAGIRSEISNALEVGCGEGIIAEHVAVYHGLEVDACDVSTVIIEKARMRNPASPVKYHVRDIMSLDGAASADLVLCCEVLEHLPNPERAIQIVKQVTLKYVIIGVPREPLWRILNLARLKYLRQLGNTPGHIQHWSCREIRSLVSRHLRVCREIRPFPWIMLLAETE